MWANNAEAVLMRGNNDEADLMWGNIAEAVLIRGHEVCFTVRQF